MAQIIIDGNRCHLKDETDFDFLYTLDSELSFKFKGVEFTRAYKGRHWDGFTRLLTRDLSFPYGLLGRVGRLYKSHGKNVVVIDDRTKTLINSISIISNLKKIDKEPYPYQLRAVDVIQNNDCGILRMATGSGKTLCSALMTAYLNKKTIIYVIGVDLLYQLHDFYGKIFNEDIGIIGDGKCDIRDINIASVWTVGQALGMKKNILTDVEGKEALVGTNKYKDIKDLMKTAKVHIFDECHLAACDTIQEINKTINPEHIYGMSASPFRDDGKDMLVESVLGGQILEIPATYLIDRGFLVKPVINFTKVPKFHEKLPKNYQTVYKKYIVENEVRNKLIIDGAERLVELGYQPLVLYDKIKHGKTLFSEIEKRVSCTLLSGKDSASVRQEAKDKLESGDIQCIVASKIFDIGVDLPSLSGLIIASGGKSSVRGYQRIGRVIRKHPGKKIAAVIDFFDQAHFLRQHSKTRYAIYCSEKGFEVRWPK